MDRILSMPEPGYCRMARRSSLETTRTAGRLQNRNPQKAQLPRRGGSPRIIPPYVSLPEELNEIFSHVGFRGLCCRRAGPGGSANWHVKSSRLEWFLEQSIHT